MNYKIVCNEEDLFDIYEQDPANGSWRFVCECFFKSNAERILFILQCDDCGILCEE